MECHCFTQQLLKGVAHLLLQIKTFLFWMGNWGQRPLNQNSASIFKHFSSSNHTALQPKLLTRCPIFISKCSEVTAAFCGRESPYNVLLLTVSQWHQHVPAAVFRGGLPVNVATLAQDWMCLPASTSLYMYRGEKVRERVWRMAWSNH